jgi:hypothetical protein
MRNDEESVSERAEPVALARHDEHFPNRLRADPRAAPAASDPPFDDAVVTVVTTRSLDLVRHLAPWRRASSTRSYVIHLPGGCVEDLTDEQLESIVGGVMVMLRKLGHLPPPPDLALVEQL